MFASSRQPSRTRIAVLAALALVLMISAVSVAQSPGSIGDVTADRVLGQTSFTVSNELQPSGQSVFRTPQGIAIDRSTPNSRIYVLLPDEDRVLGWNNPGALANGAPADLVIGQSDFNTVTPGPFDASHFKTPRGIAVDSKGNLFVSDSANGRVLVFKTPFGAGCTSVAPCKGQAAELVFGKGPAGTDFTTIGCNFFGNPAMVTISAASLCNPAGLTLDANDNLYVGDRANSRVLEYDNPLGSPGPCTPAQDGTGCPGDVVADREWGQGSTGNDFTDHVSGSALTEFGSADAVAIDSNGTIYVVDGPNGRVLGFENGLSNFTANVVLGGNGSASGNDALIGPTSIAIDSSNNVYVADESTNRVLEFDQPAASSNGCVGAGSQPGCPGDVIADLVFGQGAAGNNFINTECNDDAVSAGPDATDLCLPFGVAVDPDDNLFIADNDNNRVLEYLQPLASPGGATPTPTPTATPTPVAAPVTFTPKLLNFGKATKVGKTLSKPLTVKNTAKNTAKKKGPSVVIGRPISSDFAFVVTANTCTAPLAASKTCKITLTFTPADATSHHATLLIGTDSITGALSIPISGTGKVIKKK